MLRQVLTNWVTPKISTIIVPHDADRARPDFHPVLRVEADESIADVIYGLCVSVSTVFDGNLVEQIDGFVAQIWD